MLNLQRDGDSLKDNLMLFYMTEVVLEFSEH